MELVATLLTDVPLDAQSLRGVLMNLSRTSLAGAMLQHELQVVHSFGDAELDRAARDVKVRCRGANTAPRAALVELEKHGFQPVTAIEFQTAGDPESREDAWMLVGLYSEELRGWAVTSYLDFEEAVRRTGSETGLLHAPVGGRHRGVLIANQTLRQLTS